MPQNKEIFRITTSQKGNSIRGVMLLDPRSLSFSLLQELVKNKVRSIEDTTICMEHNGVRGYVDASRLHAINLLPQQERKRAIKRIVNSLAYSDQILIDSRTAKDDIKESISF